jgi:hypothetical protein
MTFSQSDERQILTGPRELMFLKPLYHASETLFPYTKNFTIKGNDFCDILIHTGRILDEDRIVLYLSSLQKV